MNDSKKDAFILKARKVHDDKYDYSKVDYVGSHMKVCIICPEHGEFWQTPSLHLSGNGCKKCGYIKNGNNNRTKLIDFVNRANIIHKFKYDYSKVDYRGNKTKVCIICPEHGEFWQTPGHHLQGCGCPKCNKSKLEIEIEKNFPQLEQQKSFEWLKNKSEMFLDFYDESTNVAIECQGEQHFYINPTSRFGKFGKFESICYRDKLKYKQCKEHNVNIIYYFPEEFLKYNVEFYNDKLCFHSIDDIKKYLLSLKYVKNS